MSADNDWEPKPSNTGYHSLDGDAPTILIRFLGSKSASVPLASTEDQGGGCKPCHRRKTDNEHVQQSHPNLSLWKVSLQVSNINVVLVDKPSYSRAILPIRRSAQSENIRVVTIQLRAALVTIQNKNSS